MRALLLLALFASPAGAQLINPPAIDTSQFATTGQVQAAQTAANAAQNAIPPVCSTAPAKDTLNGSAGSAPACTPPADNTRPTSVQAGNTTLAANCGWSFTFSRAFVSSVPLVWASVIDTSGNQMPCKVQTRSSTGATGICNPGSPSIITLNALTAAALTGITVAPFATTCTAGLAVMVGGREPTQ